MKTAKKQTLEKIKSSFGKELSHFPYKFKREQTVLHLKQTKKGETKETVMLLEQIIKQNGNICYCFEEIDQKGKKPISFILSCPI